MCELWSCTPEEVLRQDPALVIPILGYVNAKEAIRQSEDKVGRLTRIQAELLMNLRGGTLDHVPDTEPDLSWLLEGQDEEDG